MKACVRRFDGDQEHYFKEGCFITELSNSLDDPEVSIARARLESGKTTRWHRLHGTSERYVVVEGEGLVEVDNLPAEKVSAGDVVIIPPGAAQRISNTGTVDLIFLAICSPRFREEVYQDTEK